MRFSENHLQVLQPLCISYFGNYFKYVISFNIHRDCEMDVLHSHFSDKKPKACEVT